MTSYALCLFPVICCYGMGSFTPVATAQRRVGYADAERSGRKKAGD